MLMHWKSKVGVGKATLMAPDGYVRVKFGPIVRDRVGVTCMGHPAAPYPSLGSGQSCLIDFGRPAGLSSMEIPQVGPSKPFPRRRRLKLGVRGQKL